MSKKLIALLLALVLCVGMLAACGGNGNETTKGNDSTTGTGDATADGYVAPNLNGKKITIYTSNNKDYDLEDSYLNKLVEKHLNADLEIIEIQGSEVEQLLLQRKAPDMQFSTGFAYSMFDLVIDGAYINIYDYLDQMPNVKAWIEKPENAMHVSKYLSGNGKILAAIPVVQIGGNAMKYAFLYRKDIFDKHNLTFPTNQEEFVAVLRQLKTLYPDSYPFMMGQMTGNMTGIRQLGHLWGGAHILGGLFGTYFTLNNDGEYYYGPVCQAYKEMAQFFVELEKEGLYNPSSWTASTTEWTAAFVGNASFIAYDRVDRLPTLNYNGQQLNPDFLMTAAAPFNFGTYAATATTVATDYAGYATGYCWMIGNTDNLDNVLKYVDWLYSDEAYVMTNWGKEGESYVVNADGTKSFKEGFLESFGGNGLVVSGLWSAWQSGRTDFDAYLASCDENTRASLELAGKYTEGGQLQKYVKYTQSEQDIYNAYGKAMYSYALSEYAKFVTGQRDISEWDEVLKELKASFHYDELLAIHQSALAALEKKQ